MKNLHKKFLIKNCMGLENQTVIVTGATGGIGKAIVRHLLGLNANVIMAIRNLEKGENLKEELSKSFDGKKIQIMELDVSSFASIDKFVNDVQKFKVNHLINNAGNLTGEKHYDTNFLGPMYLSLKLLSKLNENQNSRIVFQNSISYKYAKIDWCDVQNKKANGNIRKYARAKRLIAQAVIALEGDMAKRYANVKIALVHPGVCSTNIFGNDKTAVSRFFSKIIRVCARCVFHSASTASLPAVFALSYPLTDNTQIIGPRVFGVWGKPRLARLSKKLFNKTEKENAKKLLEAEFSKFSIL